MLRVIGLVGLVFVLNTIAAAQTLDELRTRWTNNKRADLLSPLIDCRRRLPAGSSGAQEADYMIVTTMCSMKEYKADFGCDYSKALSALYGQYLWFQGRQMAIAALVTSCCYPTPNEGAQVIGHLAPPDSGKDEIPERAAGTESAMPGFVTAALRLETTELAQPGDRILGFRTTAVERSTDSFWHWKLNLEVAYTYNPGHLRVYVQGDVGAWDNGARFETRSSFWESAQEERQEGSLRRGVQKMEIMVYLLQPQAVSSTLRLYLVDTIAPDQMILKQEFPFPRVFKVP